MTIKNRVSRLETSLGFEITFEDIVKVLHDRKNGIVCDVEWQRIQSSSTWKYLQYIMKSN